MTTWRDVRKDLKNANEKNLTMLRQAKMIGPYDLSIETLANMLKDKKTENRKMAASSLAMRAIRDGETLVLGMLLPLRNPAHVVHRIRRKPSTESRGCRPPVPAQAVQRIQSMPSTFPPGSESVDDMDRIGWMTCSGI